MGVKNLWDILESCKQTLPLHHLQNKRVCVDLSCWLVQLHNVNKSQCPTEEKVYLRSLFHRIRALIALNCSLIFVTDGSIPAIKLSSYRRRLGSEVVQDEKSSQWISSLPRNKGSEFSCMIKEAKVLGMALGIPSLDGLEEAEAQCALLNSECLCDGCFTSDSDVFLFGARTVYRDICLGDGGHVVCYSMGDIEKKLGLGRKSLIALALFLGSDYSHGVHGLGRETACQIIKSIGDDTILHRVLTEGLVFTRKRGAKKDVNSNACGERNSDINKKKDQNPRILGEFSQVINAYMNPKCHSLDSEVVQRLFIQHPFQRTHLHQICEQFFGWSAEKTDEYILPKIAERDLRRFSNLRTTSRELGVCVPCHQIPVVCPVSGIIKNRKIQGKEYFEVSWETVDGLKSSIVPADLLESACPEKIAEFVEQKVRGKNGKSSRTNKRENKGGMPAVDLHLHNLQTEIDSQSSKANISKHEGNRQDIRSPTKSRNWVALQEIDIKLQSLLLDIEASKNNTLKAPTFASASGSSALEVIDLLSPSPPLRHCKMSKSQQVFDRSIKIIDLSESD